jgi:hypothetical protein
MREFKKEAHMGNFKALHTIHKWVSVDKNHVIMTRSLSPGLYYTYAFIMHATSSRNVTQCMEYGDSKRIDSYFAIKGGEICGTGVGSTVRILLIIDKLWHEIRKVRLSNFSRIIFWINLVPCKHK